VAAVGTFKVEAFLLVTDTDPVAAPCGLCRQVMNEFLDKTTPIYLANLDGIKSTYTIADLLPRAFGPSDL